MLADKNEFFKDLKIVDLSTVLAGPSVGTFFAELGANVLKVEHPELGDVTRSWKLPSEDPNQGVSSYFSAVNYGKKYLQLNLNQAEDKAILMNHLSEADILLSNFKKGDAEKFGLTKHHLNECNPQLIHGKITGFGSESDRVAYDLILQAETGFMSMNGDPDGLPTKMPVALIDVLAAHHLKEGLLVALLNRYKNKEGCTVEVSLYDAAVGSLINQASAYLMEGVVAERRGSLHPNIAPYGEIFKSIDGKYLTFAIGSNRHFDMLLETLSLAHLQKDERFTTNQKRVINRSELALYLSEEIGRLESNYIFNSLLQKNVPCALIKSLDEVLNSEDARKLVLEETIENRLTKRIKSTLFKWT